MKAISFNKFIKLLESVQTDSNSLLDKYLDLMIRGKESDIKIISVDPPSNNFEDMAISIEEKGDYGSGRGSDEDEFNVTINILIKPKDLEIEGKEFADLASMLGINSDFSTSLTFNGTISVDVSYWSRPGSNSEPPDGGSDIEDSSIIIDEVLNNDGDPIDLSEENKKDIEILFSNLSKYGYSEKDFQNKLSHPIVEAP